MELRSLPTHMIRFHKKLTKKGIRLKIGTLVISRGAKLCREISPAHCLLPTQRNLRTFAELKHTCAILTAFHKAAGKNDAKP